VRLCGRVGTRPRRPRLTWPFACIVIHRPKHKDIEIEVSVGDAVPQRIDRRQRLRRGSSWARLYVTPSIGIAVIDN
jgi:hypothetical protein